MYNKTNIDFCWPKYSNKIIENSVNICKKNGLMLLHKKRCNRRRIKIKPIHVRSNNCILETSKAPLKSSILLKQVIDNIMLHKKINIFLSHSWTNDQLGRDNHLRVCKLNERLSDYGLNTWIDINCLKGHIVQSMCNGIDNSDIIIVCICRKYIEKCNGIVNSNCKLELDYSYSRKGNRNIIGIVMEPDCLQTESWVGPVGAYLGNKLYISMVDDEMSNIKSLVEEIIRVVKLQNND